MRSPRIIPSAQLREGDIIDYAAPMGSIRAGGSRDMRKGLIHHVMYDTQHKDAVAGFFLFEIAETAAAAKSGYPYFRLPDDSASFADEASVVLEPIRIDNAPKSFGRDNEYTTRYASLDDRTQDALDRAIAALGGEQKLFAGMQDYARIKPEQWDSLNVYNRARPERRDEAIVRETKPKKPKKAKYAHAPVATDMTLEHSVQALNLDPALVSLFQKPKGHVRPIDSLHGLFVMARDNPQALDKYLPKEKILIQDIELSDLEDVLHPAVFNGLQEPRKSADVQPVRTLSEAFDLVTNREEELAGYMYMGPVHRETAKQQITQLYKEHAIKAVARDFDRGDIARTIKSAYGALQSAYLTAERTKEIPSPFRGPDGKPLWFKRAL